MPSDSEEIVIETYPMNAKHLRPHTAQDTFRFIPGRNVFVVILLLGSAWIRQTTAIYLTVERER